MGVGMNTIIEKQACVGCGVCAARCPRACITMTADSEGFRYPQIDAECCVDCGLCRAVCPALKVPAETAEPSAYAAYNRDEAVRSRSSSGGIFRLLAEQVLREGGAVAGAAWNTDGELTHQLVRDSKALDRLYGSKYLQSRTDTVFAEAESVLKSGKTVLFSGTPCQIAAMRAYLKTPYERLLCVSVVCHGVPSPAVWESYRSLLEAQHGAKTTDARFRDKRDGWKAFSLALSFDNGQSYASQHGQDRYMQCFLKNYILRPSCYACRFKNTRADADLMLADFWGLSHIDPQFGDDRGVSLVIVNTSGGQALWEAVREQTAYKAVDLQAAVPYNTAIVRSVPPVPKRERFFETYRTHGFDEAYRRYVRTTALQRLKQRGTWYLFRLRRLFKKS